MSASTAVLLFRSNATAPTPLTAGQLRALDESGKLLNRIPLADLLTFDENDEHGLNLFKTLFQRHGNTLLFRVVIHRQHKQHQTKDEKFHCISPKQTGNRFSKQIILLALNHRLAIKGNPIKSRDRAGFTSLRDILSTDDGIEGGHRHRGHLLAICGHFACGERDP